MVVRARTREQVERLLREGIKSEEEIALLVGLRLSTIKRVAAYLLDQRKEASPLRSTCPCCGMQVIMPCVACEAAQEASTRYEGLIHVKDESWVGFDLLPHDYERYLEVLASNDRVHPGSPNNHQEGGRLLS